MNVFRKSALLVCFPLLSLSALAVDTDQDGLPDDCEIQYELNRSSGAFDALAPWWKIDEGAGLN